MIYELNILVIKDIFRRLYILNLNFKSEFIRVGDPPINRRNADFEFCGLQFLECTINVTPT